MDSRYASVRSMEPAVDATKPLPQVPSKGLFRTTNDLSTRSKQSQKWLPMALRPISLVLFVALFIALEAALVAMWKLGTRLQGFAFVIHDDHGWSYRYGPTALFVIIISLWRQVDYSCKVLKPWEELQRGSAKAENSLFLDYLSPFVPVSVWKALARGHTTVVITGIGFLVLKIIAIVSTGLFLVVPSTFTDVDIQAVSTTFFNFTPMEIGLNNAALFNTIGITAYGLSHPEGTSADAAYQKLIFPQNSTYGKAKFSAAVQALYPSVTCEQRTFARTVANFTYNDGIPASRLLLTDDGPCGFSSNHTLPRPWTTFYPPNVTFISSDFVTCNQAEETWVYLDIIGIGLSQTFPSNVSYSSNDWYKYSNIQALSSSMQLGQTLSMLCKLDHELQPSDVQYDLNATPPSVTIARQTSSTSVPIPAFDLEARMRSALTNLDIFPKGDTRWISDRQNALVTLLAESSVYKDVFESQTLRRLTENLFKQLMIQVVAESVLDPRDESRLGQVSFEKSRLVMNDISFGIMSGALALMILLSLFLFLKRPHIDAPHGRVDTFRQVAMVLSNSTALHNKFQTVQGSAKTVALGQFQNVRYSLSSQHERFASEPSIRIEAIPSDLDTELITRTNEARWWYPASLNKFSLGLLLVVPLLLIAVLEILQRQSDARNGFATLPTNISKIVQNGYISYIPAIVMLLTAALYTSLDFNAAVFAPLTSLKRDVCDVDQISSSVVGQLPPMALFSNLKHRQWGAVSALLAALIGSILTIIVSGLYTIVPIYPQSTLPVHRSDIFQPTLWNTSFHNNQRSTTGGANVVLTVLENTNVSYPRFSYDELVFPSFELDVNELSQHRNATGMVRLNVPALRGNLNCQRFLPSQMNISEETDTSSKTFSVYVNMPVPARCLSALSTRPDWNATNLGYRFGSSLPIKKPPSGPDLVVVDDVQQRWIFADDVEPETPLGCPSVSWSWAAHDYNLDQTTYHTMYCSQEIQQVETTLTLNLPNMTTSTLHPPIVDETSVKLVSSEPNGGETAFNWYFDIMATGFSMVGHSEFSAPIFGAVFYGRKPIDIRAMLDDENKVVDGIQGIYRRLMTQIINRNMRTNLTDGDAGQYGQDQPHAVVEGIFVPEAGQQRIVQQMIPKLILQCMLGVMFLLGLVSIWTGGYRRLVPWNPCSIAGKAILVAGSKICTMKERFHDEDLTQPQTWPLQESRSLGRKSDTKVAIQKITRAHSDTSSIGRESVPLINLHPSETRTTAPEISTDDNPTANSPMLSLNNPRRPSQWSTFGFAADRTDRETTRQKVEWHSQANSRDMSTARFRLGWWSKEGYFMGPDDRYMHRMRADPVVNMMNNNMNMHEETKAERRYGIDFV